MSDDIKFASPDVAWPATERRLSPARPVIPISRRELADLRAFRHARDLARRWDRGDEDVTIQDIINALVGKD